MTDKLSKLTKAELIGALENAKAHLAETKLLGVGYYRIKERYQYAVEADERFIELVEKKIEEYDQQQLNPNQKVVFEWAKNYLISIKDIAWFIDELAFLPTIGGKMRYKEVAHIYESLSNTEKLSLLNVIIAWALEQEKE